MRNPSRPWTDAERTRAEALWRAGYSKPSIGIAIGRSPSSVRHFLISAELVRIQRQRVLTWTKAKDARLATLWDDRTKTAADIGKELGFTPGAVKRRAYNIGLPSRGPVVFRREPKQRSAPDAPAMPTREERGIAHRRKLGGYPVSVHVNGVTAYAYPVKLGVAA